MLFAGTSLLFRIKYSNLIVIVKRLIQRDHETDLMGNAQRKSAGNLISNEKGSSETKRIESEFLENIKPIASHVLKHAQKLNDHEFGYYLAGLIDGDGHFSIQNQFILIFHEDDAFSAYNIRTRIGFGTVSKVKGKKAYKLIISKKAGIIKVLEFINGKIRTELRFNQIIKNILLSKRYEAFSRTPSSLYPNGFLSQFSINNGPLAGNHWLAGFTDADGGFQIKILYRENRTEVRLNYQVDLKTDSILQQIKDFFGGHIGYRKSNDTYYYGSTSFGSAKKVISYFDHYKIQSSKHLNYLKWRKAYLIMQDRGHTTVSGLNAIINLKSTMNSKANFLNDSNFK